MWFIYPAALIVGALIAALFAVWIVVAARLA